MEAVACAAQVGKGTVFRRFGDRAGLLLALLDHQEQRFQAAFMAGPALGPGAPARERLHAFGPAAMRHERAHLDLYLAAQPEAPRRELALARVLRVSHLAALLRQAGTDADPQLAAHTLAGFLDVALVDHLVTRRGMPLERVEAGWHDLVDRLLSSPAEPGRTEP